MKSILFVSLLGAALAATPLSAQQTRAAQQLDVNGTGSGLGPSISTSGDLTAAIWNDGSTGGSNHVYVSTSDGRGLTWTAPVQVDQDPGAAKKYTQSDSVHVFGDSIYVFWSDERNSTTTDEIFFNVSHDRGVTWGTEQRMDKGYPAGTGAIRDWRVGAQQGFSAGNDLFVLMQSVDPTNSADEELHIAITTDGGTTWGNAPMPDPLLTSGDVDNIGIAIDGAFIHLAWAGDGFGGSSFDALYYQRSDNFGVTWSNANPIILSSAPAGGGDVEFEVHVDTDNTSSLVAVGWLEERISTTEEEVRCIISDDLGITWPAADTLIGQYTAGTHDADGMDVRVASGNVLVVWDDNRSGSDLIYAARTTDEGATWDPDVQVSSANGGGFPAFAPNGGGSTLALTYTTNVFPNIAEASLSSDAGTTWLVGVATSATVADVDFAVVAWNSFYGNLMSVWLDDQLGTNHVYVGGYRPQTLTPVGTFAAGQPINFTGARFAGVLPRGGVLISGAAGDGIVLTDGRKTGLSQHSFFTSAVGFLGSALSGAMQPDGSFATPTINLPGGIAPGTTLHFVGIEFLNNNNVGPISDVVTLVTT
ncbi:MAG: sialidase family protein [Planctomycetota bacterium]|nr:sialidase family protein [Planctomycetota bacterium]